MSFAVFRRLLAYCPPSPCHRCRPRLNRSLHERCTKAPRHPSKPLARHHHAWTTPAGSDVTSWIERRANEFLKENLRGVKRMPWEKALRLSTTHEYDFLGAYVTALDRVIDMEVIRSAKIRMGVDPMGGGRTLLVRHRQPIRPRPLGHECRDRPHVPFHATRLGRSRSHGPLVELRHAERDRRP